MGSDTTTIKGRVKIAYRYTIDNCKKNSDTLFIFGDNQLREGFGGQAIIRDQRNAIGIATKASPSEYWSDNNFNDNKLVIYQDIENMENYMKEEDFKYICFPSSGLGTGLAKLHILAPKTFLYLCETLLFLYNYNNLAGLKTD